MITHPLPDGETPSPDYLVSINGQSVPVYSCRVSAIPFNTEWPGHQRPLDQTETAAFLCLDIAEDEAGAMMEITVPRGFGDVVMRPLSKTAGAYAVEKNIVRFKIPGPGSYTLEADGHHHALHIFVNPAKDYGVRADDPSVLWFGPGTHRPGNIELRSGQTLFIDAGAVVHASVTAQHASNLKILGHGILCNSEFDRANEDTGRPKGTSVIFTDCANIEVDGVVFRDASYWTLTLFSCDNIVVNNVKLVGMWRHNADGIDLVNCRNAIVSGCFVRTFDDGVVLKGYTHILGEKKAQNVENILVERCTVWCDWGRALEIGAETGAPEFRNITFRDCDLIHNAHVVMDIQNSGFAHVHRVAFEDIRVEYSRHCDPPQLQTGGGVAYVPAKEPHVPVLMCSVLYRHYLDMLMPGHELGRTSDIVFDGIHVTADEGLPVPLSAMEGFDEQHTTSGVTIRNLWFNGRRLQGREQANVLVGKHARDIRVE